MSIRHLILSCVALATLALGCSDDPVPTQADIIWRLRCVAQGGCSGFNAHDVNFFDGQEGHEISCSVESRTEGVRALYLTVQKGSEYGIEVQNAQFNSTGAIVGNGCQVRATENVNIFEGPCGGSTPSETQPCRLGTIGIEGSTVSGNILCEHLPLRGVPTTKRELTAADNANQGAEFRFYNCAGL